MNQGIGFANNPPLQFLQLTVVNADFAPIIFPRSKWLEKHLVGMPLATSKREHFLLFCGNKTMIFSTYYRKKGFSA